MYESLGFDTYETPRVLTSAKDFQALKTETFNIAVDEIFRADFAISGTIMSMPFFMSSNNARTNLFYPEFFALFDMDEHYYTKRHNLHSYELCFTLEGEGFLEYKNKRYIIKKGEGFFIDCRLEHHYKTHGKQWLRTVFHFNGSQADNYFTHFSQNDNVKFSVAACPNFELYQLNILKTTQKIMPYQEYQTSCLFTLMLTDLLNSDTSDSLEIKKMHPAVIKEVIDYIKENYAQDLKFEKISKEFGISRSHFSREFKKYVGFAPKEYLLQYRINQAKSLLRNTDITIREIGYRVGFQDESHFIQMFKKKEGIPPLKFRNSNVI